MRIKMWLASLLLAIAPVAASAVSIPVNGTVSVGPNEEAIGSFTAPQMSPVEFSIKATELIRVDTAATALRLAGFEDLVVTFGVNGVLLPFAPTMQAGSGAVWAFPLIDLQMDDVLTVKFAYTDIGAGSGGQASFLTTPIPLPAAGWMLVSALAGMGILARRRAAA